MLVQLVRVCKPRKDSSTKSSVTICYRDRRTSEILTEAIAFESTLRWFYENPFGFLLFNVVFNNVFCCWLHGKWQDRSQSRQRILKFATRYCIDVDEAELPVDDYPNFNEFFSRRLKPGIRPIAPDNHILACPADGKVLVYPRLDVNARLPVKGYLLSLSDLLRFDTASRYQQGTALVIRLAPSDYHRFHFPDDGIASPAQLVRGKYHSVNPVALSQVPDIFSRNQRAVTYFASTHFGNIVCVEIGAFWVGTIVQTYFPGNVFKGQEKGYFRLGGSTIVLLFEPNVLRFDSDLIEDSAFNLEVQVKVGEAIGQRIAGEMQSSS